MILWVYDFVCRDRYMPQWVVDQATTLGNRFSFSTVGPEAQTWAARLAYTTAFYKLLQARTSHLLRHILIFLRLCPSETDFILFVS